MESGLFLLADASAPQDMKRRGEHVKVSDATEILYI